METCLSNDTLRRLIDESRRFKNRAEHEKARIDELSILALALHKEQTKKEKQVGKAAEKR
jgi:hypothetical protein